MTFLKEGQTLGGGLGGILFLLLSGATWYGLRPVYAASLLPENRDIFLSSLYKLKRREKGLLTFLGVGCCTCFIGVGLQESLTLKEKLWFWCFLAQNFFLAVGDLYTGWLPNRLTTLVMATGLLHWADCILALPSSLDQQREVVFFLKHVVMGTSLAAFINFLGKRLRLPMGGGDGRLYLAQVVWLSCQEGEWVWLLYTSTLLALLQACLFQSRRVAFAPALVMAATLFKLRGLFSSS